MGFHKSYCTPPVTEVIPQTFNMAYLLAFTLEINQTSVVNIPIVPLSVWARLQALPHLQQKISKASSIRDLLIPPSWRSS